MTTSTSVMPGQDVHGVENATITRAAGLAAFKHYGQVDKAGVPYIRHVSRVARYTFMMGGSHDAVAVAWLHDIVEDTPTTFDDLRNSGFDERIVAGVDAITRREWETNREYVLRVAQNDLAVIVKRADYLDNLDPGRMAMLDREVALRLIRVMADSQYILGKALMERDCDQKPPH